MHAVYTNRYNLAHTSSVLFLMDRISYDIQVEKSELPLQSFIFIFFFAQETAGELLMFEIADISLWLGSKLQPQVNKLKYHRVLFTCESKLECEMGWQIGTASALMLTYQTV